MKLYVFEVLNGNIFLSQKDSHGAHKFLGTVDLPIEIPKKIVTRQILPLPEDGNNYYNKKKDDKTPIFIVPGNAKNIRCLYDVEE